MLLSNIKGQTVEIWETNFQNNDYFIVLRHGKQKVEIEMNPFSKASRNDNMYKKLSKWSHKNLEGLTVTKINI